MVSSSEIVGGIVSVVDGSTVVVCGVVGSTVVVGSSVVVGSPVVVGSSVVVGTVTVVVTTMVVGPFVTVEVENI